MGEAPNTTLSQHRETKDGTFSLSPRVRACMMGAGGCSQHAAVFAGEHEPRDRDVIGKDANVGAEGETDRVAAALDDRAAHPVPVERRPVRFR